MKSSTASTARITWLAATIAVVMIAQQIAFKALRDGLFLSHFDVAEYSPDEGPLEPPARFEQEQSSRV